MSFWNSPAVAASYGPPRTSPRSLAGQLGLTPPTAIADTAGDRGNISEADRLRFIDLCFEASAIARAAFPTSMNGEPHPAFGAAYRFVRAVMMADEGLPDELLGDGKTANQRHMENMARLHPTGNWPAWARAQSEGDE